MPVNIPISTCVSSSPHGVNSQVRLSVSAFATIERRWMENRGSKKQQRQEREQRRGGEEEEAVRGGGRWQVDYGRRSGCLETAGTRDARLLGDQHDAMTSAV